MIRFSTLIKLAVKQGWRSLVTGKQLLYFIALALAVTCISFLAWLNQGIYQGITNEQTKLAGGELAITSNQLAPTSLTSWLSSQGYKLSQQLSLTSLLAFEEELVLSQLIAVDKQYPLMGKLEIQTVKQKQEVSSGPAEGEIWLEPSLASRLGVSLGDSLEVGATQLLVTAWLEALPDQSSQLINFAPKALVAIASLENSQLLGPYARFSSQLNLLSPQTLTTSRVTSKQLSNQQEAIVQFLAKHQLNAEVKLTNQQPTAFAHALTKLQDFMLVFSLAALVLASLALVLAVASQQGYLSQNFALLVSLGLSPRQALVVQLIQLTLIASLASWVGILIGYLVLLAISKILSGLLTFNLFALATASFKPVAFSWLAGLGLSFSLIATALVSLMKINTWQALQGKGANLAFWGRLNLSLSFIFLALLANGLSTSWLINLSFIGGLVVLASFLALIGWLIFFGLNQLRPRFNWSFRQALRSLVAYPVTSLVQLASFTLVLTLLLVTSRLANDLIDDWQELSPQNKPNVFVLDLPSGSKQEFNDFLQAENLAVSEFYPLTRARLVERNGKPIKEALSRKAQQDNSLHRELNLTFSASLPASNQLVAGSWWPEKAKNNYISVEEGLADRLSLKLGDQLGFNLAGSLLTAEILSIRKVNWQSLEPNFFIIFSPNSLEASAANLLTSFNLPTNKNSLLTELNKQFPSVVFIDLRQIIVQLANLLQQLSKVLTLLIVFSLVAGLLVSFALLEASKFRRKQENFLLHVFGATPKQLKQSLSLEFAFIGWVAGVLACLVAEVVYGLIANLVFNFSWQPRLEIWLLVPLLASVFLGFITRLGYNRLV